MLLVLVVMVVGATEVHGSASTGVQATEAIRIVPFVHAQLGVAHEFDELTIAAQASVLLRFEPSISALVAQDLGSSLDVSVRLRRGWFLRAKLLPLNANVLLPTSDWANRWGRATVPFSPALVLALDTPQFHAWLALRPSVTFERPLTWRQGVLAGVATTALTGFRWDVRAAVLDYGKVAVADPLAPALPSLFAIIANGLAGCVWNEDVGPALDFTMYVSDPSRFERFLAREPQRHARAFRVTLEGGVGAQWLPSGNSLRPQPAGFVDAQARVRLGRVRLFATTRLRTATQASFDSLRTPVDGGSRPELTALAGVDVRICETGLRPGVLLRVMQNALPKTPESPLELGDALPPSVGASTWAVKLSLTWSAGNIGGAAGELEIGTSGVRWLLLGQVRF